MVQGRLMTIQPELEMSSEKMLVQGHLGNELCSNPFFRKSRKRKIYPHRTTWFSHVSARSQKPAAVG